MQRTYSNLHLYRPIKERSCVSPSLSPCRSLSSPSKTPASFQQKLFSKRWEEGPAETAMLGHADKSGLTDFKETLRALDDSSESCWLTELLPLCSDCQAFMSMGNQLGTKPKPNCHSYTETWDALSNSPRVQISWKRRRRAEGHVYTSDLQDNLKMVSGTPRAPLKARRLRKLQRLRSSSFEEWDFEEERPIICTPTVRRKKIIRRERDDINTLTHELKPLWRVKLPNTSSASLSRSKSETVHLSPRQNMSEEEKYTPTDSDTDLSEYDNEMYSVFFSNTSMEAKSNKTASQKQDEEKADIKSSQQRLEVMGQRAAARRVMGKIEEVEGIIRRVSLTSLDWIKECHKGEEEPYFLSDGWKTQVSLQKSHRAEISTQSPLEDQNRKSSGDKPLFVEELCALGDALRRSLQQALRMEGSKAESEGFKEPEETFCEQSHTTEGSLNPQSPPYLINSVVPNNASSHPLLAGGKISPTPSLSENLEVSPIKSSSLERLSPMLPPMLISRLSTDDQQAETSHRVWTEPLEDTAIICGARDGERARESDHRDTQEQFTEKDYLLSSGKNVNKKQQFRWMEAVKW